MRKIDPTVPPVAQISASLFLLQFVVVVLSPICIVHARTLTRQKPEWQSSQVVGARRPRTTTISAWVSVFFFRAAAVYSTV